MARAVVGWNKTADGQGKRHFNWQVDLRMMQHREGRNFALPCNTDAGTTHGQKCNLFRNMKGTQQKSDRKGKLWISNFPLGGELV